MFRPIQTHVRRLAAFALLAFAWIGFLTNTADAPSRHSDTIIKFQTQVVGLVALKNSHPLRVNDDESPSKATLPPSGSLPPLADGWRASVSARQATLAHAYALLSWYHPRAPPTLT